MKIEYSQRNSQEQNYKSKFSHPSEFIKLEDKEENQYNKQVGLIIVGATFKNKNIKILLDTGSEASLVKESVIQDVVDPSEIMRIPKLYLQDTTGKKMGEVNKLINMEIKIKDSIINTQALIIKDIQYDMIMGTDELEKQNVIINYPKKKVRFADEEVNMKSEVNELEKGDRSKEETQGNSLDTEIEEEIENNEEIIKLGINNIIEGNEPGAGTEIKGAVENESGDEQVKKPKCGERYVEKVNEILNKYVNLVNEETRVALGYVHSIKVKNIENFKAKVYPIPYKYRQDVRQEINSMLDRGLIERADTPFINPLVVVKKNNGELRLCLDARNINSYTVKQYEAPQNIESIFGRLTNPRVFTKIDLKHSFWLIPLHEESRKYTGFMVDGITYQFRVVPYGLQSACSSLVRALHSIFDRYEEFISHYVDDIMIYSDNEEDHVKHVEITLAELNKAGLKINLEKCEFFQESITYLGYLVTAEGIEMDPSRTDAIRYFKTPHNLRTLRGFIGMVNYYKRLIPNLSGMLEPMLELLRKNTKWNWTEERDIAFREIKFKFCETLKVYHPDYSLPFLLRTDASIKRLAGVLMQERDGQQIPIYFISRTTKLHERKYGISELELASVVYCLTKMRYYLLGNKVTVETDHAALTSIMRGNCTNNRIYRWCLLIQEFAPEIRYIPGKENVVADALSRQEDTRKSQCKQITVGLNRFRERQGPYSEEGVIQSQQLLTEKEKKNTVQIDGFTIMIRNDMELYVITEELARTIIQDLHLEFAHPGARKTWMIFRENYYSRRDLQIAKAVTRACSVCQLTKKKTFTNQYMPKSVIPTTCLDILAIDYLSQLVRSTRGNTNILVTVDVFTKFVKLFPCRRTNAKTTIEKIQCYVQHIGKPNKILLDNATYFRGKEFKRHCEREGIELRFTSIRHPQANVSERYIQEVVKYLRILCSNHHRDWESQLPLVEDFINNTPNLTTLESPRYLLTGEEPPRKWEASTVRDYAAVMEKVNTRIRRNAEKYRKKMEKPYRRKRRFEKGDLVIAKNLRVSDVTGGVCAKLLQPFTGPWEVVTETPVNSYMLKDPVTGQRKGIYHINDIYEYVQ